MVGYQRSKVLKDSSDWSALDPKIKTLCTEYYFGSGDNVYQSPQNQTANAVVNKALVPEGLPF